MAVVGNSFAIRVRVSVCYYNVIIMYNYCDCTMYVQVLFELVREPCPGMNLSVFILIFQGLGSFEFAVTSTHIENGSANFNLPHNNIIYLTDICTMRGVIFGSNDAGNSTTADIQLPSGEDKFVYYIPYPLFQMNCYVHIFFVECGPSPYISTPVLVITSTPHGIPSSSPPHTTVSPTTSSRVLITIIAGFSYNV